MRRISYALVIMAGLLLASGVYAQQPDAPYIVAVLCSDGRWYEGDSCGGAVVTPSPEPTHTPTITLTPSPTIEPTPTQEPAITPSPTQPPLKVCGLRAQAYNLRIRSGPGVTYGQTGTWQSGTSGTFDFFAQSGAYFWAQWADGRGWSAVYDTVAREWLVVGILESELCPDVTGWSDDLIPPAPIAARTVLDGPHCLLGGGCSVTLNYVTRMSTFKSLEGTFDIGLRAQERNPRLVSVCRIFADRPEQADYDNPERYYAKIAPRLPTWCQYVEIENEHTGPQQGFEYWAQWSIRMAQLFNARRNQAVLAFGFGPGNPSMPDMVKLVDYMRWSDNHPLSDGRYNGIAMHAAAFATFEPPAIATWINNAWYTTERWTELGRAVLLANTGYDMAGRRFALAATEVGLSDGYSGTWSYIWTCDQITDAYRETKRRAKVDLFHWWNFGEIGQWHSDHRCAAQIWQ